MLVEAHRDARGDLHPGVSAVPGVELDVEAVALSLDPTRLRVDRREGRFGDGTRVGHLHVAGPEVELDVPGRQQHRQRVVALRGDVPDAVELR